MPVIDLPSVPFEVLRYINNMDDEGDCYIFGRVKYYNDESISFCRLMIRRGMDTDLNEKKSETETIYIVNSDGEKVEISTDYVKEEDFDNEEELKNQFDNATVVGEEFDYSVHAGLLPEEWTVACGMAQTVL